jgi:3-hydroxybutyryl-CoA dehydrogenase
MGAALSVCFQRSGYRVVAWDHDPRRLAALETTARALDSWLDQHVGPAPGRGGSIEPQSNLGALDEQAEIVVDCIVEDLEQKVALFKQMRRCRDRGALFLTITSGLSITDMGQRSGASHLLAGTHFWNPPHLMPLVEVVRGRETPDHIVDQACRIVASLGKLPVRVRRDVPGFIGNRLLHAMWREALYLVEQGIATAENIDLVARLTFGLRMPAVGPLENMDLVGLDLIETIQRYLLPDLADNHSPSPALANLVKAGNLGVKSAQGFYDWQSRTADTVIQRRDNQIVHQLRFLTTFEHNSPGAKDQVPG